MMNLARPNELDFSLVDLLLESDQSIDLDSRLIKLSKKSIIFREREIPHSIYQVRTGLVKSSRLTTEGVEQITNFHLSGEMFGFESLLLPVYSTNAVALTDVTLLRIVQKDLEHSEGIYDMLYKHLTREYIRSQNHLAMLNKTRSEVRVAAFIGDILKRMSANGERVQGFTFGRMDMANYLSLSVETVCRVLRRLKLEGAIEVKKTRIEVIDWNRLNKIGSY